MIQKGYAIVYVSRVGAIRFSIGNRMFLVAETYGLGKRNINIFKSLYKYS